MIRIRHAAERGRTKNDWLDSWHSFSFADYVDHENVQFRTLRVLNDDWIAGHTGFPLHPHRNMEIVTYVLGGELEHKDSQGSKGRLTKGGIQRMTAGSGIMHSEANPGSEPLTLLQIWIIPRERNLPPSYEDSSLEAIPGDSRLKKIAGPTAEPGVLTIQQDAEIYVSRLDSGEATTLDLSSGQAIYIHLIEGDLSVNGTSITPGDAVQSDNEPQIRLETRRGSHALVFVFD